MNISERMPRHKQMRPIGDLEDPKFNIPIRNLAEEFENMEETPVVADLPSANSPDVPTPGPLGLNQGMGSEQNQAAETGPGSENMLETPVVAKLPSNNSPDVPTPGPDQGMGSFIEKASANSILLILIKVLG